MKKYKYAITVGRFQNWKLHPGYLTLFSMMESLAEKNLVFVGDSGKKSKLNPLHPAEIARFLAKLKPLPKNTRYLVIHDRPDDNIEWSNTLIDCVLNIVSKEGLNRDDCVFVGGSDSYINVLKEHYPSLNFHIIGRTSEYSSSEDRNCAYYSFKLALDDVNKEEAAKLLMAYIAGFNEGINSK